MEKYVNIPNVLKLAGAAIVVGAAIFAPTGVRIALLIGTGLVAVGVGYARLKG